MHNAQLFAAGLCAASPMLFGWWSVPLLIVAALLVWNPSHSEKRS